MGYITEKFPVYVDDRQKENGVTAEKIQRRLKEYEVIKCRLEVGDVNFAKVGLEIKNADDFVTSFFAHDLSRQTANVVRNFEVGRLVVIGNWKYELLTKHKNAMQCYHSILGEIAVLSLFHVAPLFCYNEREFLSILKTMVDFSSGAKGGEGAGRPILFSKKNRDKKQVCSDLLTALDGVSRKTADQWLEEYGTIEAIVNSSEKQLAETQGIGKKTAHYVYDILH